MDVSFFLRKVGYLQLRPSTTDDRNPPDSVKSALSHQPGYEKARSMYKTLAVQETARSSGIFGQNKPPPRDIVNKKAVVVGWCKEGIEKDRERKCASCAVAVANVPIGAVPSKTIETALLLVLLIHRLHPLFQPRDPGLGLLPCIPLFFDRLQGMSRAVSLLPQRAEFVLVSPGFLFPRVHVVLYFFALVFKVDEGLL